MSRYIYEIDENNGISFWDTENPLPNNDPFMYQPDYPNGQPWGSRQDAEQWAEYAVAYFTDPKNGKPGQTPEEPFIPYVEPEVVEE